MKKTLLVSLLALATASGLRAASFSLDYRLPPAKPGAAAKALAAAAPAAADSNVLREEFLPAGSVPALAGELAVGDTLSFRLFDGVEVSAVVTDAAPDGDETRTFFGRVGPAGAPRSFVALKSRNGLQAYIQDLQSKRTFTVSATARGAFVREVSGRRGGCAACEEASALRPLRRAAKPAGGDERLADSSSPANVDLLLVFDSRAAAWAAENGYDVQDFAKMQVAKMNAALANTGIDSKARFRLRAANVLGFSLGTSTKNAVSAVRNKRKTSGGDDTSVVAAWRKDVGADIVCLLIDTGSAYGTTGTGFSLYNYDNPSSFADSAYNATAIRSDAGSHTLTHEVGHNMGAGHADAMADFDNCGPQSYDYSSGYYFTGSDGENYHTIMAYDDDGWGNSYVEAPYFSSPSHYYKGAAVGDSMHDNTRAIKNLCADVAAFRAETSGGNSIAVTFNPNGGTCKTSYKTYSPGATYGELPTPTRTGYTFLGWYTAASGGSRVSASGTVRSGVLYARWKVMTYTVVFNANGGSGDTSVTVDYGSALGALPTPTRKGYAFSGWYTSPYGGQAISRSTRIYGAATYYAHWSESPDPYLCGTASGAVPTDAASEYLGYLKDSAGNVAGTIQVKVGRPSRATGQASVRATAIVRGAKAALKARGGKVAIAAGGPTAVELAGGEACTVTLGALGLSGSYGPYKIDGARNLFASKNRTEQDAAASVLARWRTSFNVAWSGGCAGVTIGNKGKAKVSGVLADGSRISARGQLLFGEAWICVPVAAAKSKTSFCLWIPADGYGETAITGLGDGVVVGRPGALANGAAFRVGKDQGATLWQGKPGTLLDAYLPNVRIESVGDRWTLPKAGKVAFLRGTTTVDATKTLLNPSGLRLSYKPKDGSFKGSFRAYAVVDGRLKANTVAVNGVMVGQTGYATAAIRKGGAVLLSFK